jgi:hypothetical protein
MFSTEKIKSYLNNFTGNGDSDEKFMKLVFYVTPITYELASEVSPLLADRLFRNSNGKDWQPAQEMPKASFSSIQVPKCNLTFHPHDADMKIDNGVMVPAVAISNLRAQRAYPDKPEFRLEFDCVVPMDQDTMELVHKYYKSTCFLTFEASQAEIEFEEDQIGSTQKHCEECEEPAIYEDSEHSFFCGKHVRAAHGEVKLIVRKETPAEAEARLAREAEENDKKQPGEETEEVPEEAETGSFINARNKRTRRRRETVN